MRWTWKWNDLLAILLVLLTCGTIVAVIPLVHDDPALKRARARKDCQTLARAIQILPKLEKGQSIRAEGEIGSEALLFTWDPKVDPSASGGRWPRLSEKIRPWRDYDGSPGTLSTTSWNVRTWLEGYVPHSLIEKEHLMKAKRVGFDPWGKPYLINIGNMRNTEVAEPGIAWITWALSAGPNGIIETPDYHRPSDASEPDTVPDMEVTKGDDIGCMVAIRRAP